ncbi:MAG: SMC-Scp complex subunit ScpB [Elusimicrobiaceae bacterium]
MIASDEEIKEQIDGGAPAAAPVPSVADTEGITEAELRKIIETVLFITDKPVSLGKICAVAEIVNSDFTKEVIARLQREYLESGSAVQIIEVGGGYQMSTKPEFGRWVRRLYGEKMATRLSAAALETLAIVAYRQPLTRAEIESVRGVDVVAPLETLIERGLVKVVGRKEAIGRPLMYGTTAEFLRLFGLGGLKDLPKLESFGIELPDFEDDKQPDLFEMPENNTQGLSSELVQASLAADAAREPLETENGFAEPGVLEPDFAAGEPAPAEAGLTPEPAENAEINDTEKRDEPSAGNL